MQYHIQEMMSKGLKKTINEQLDVSSLFKGRQDVIRTGPLQVSLEVKGNEGFIEVEGELSADLVLACSRCLDPIEEHTVIPFHEYFKPAASAAEGDEVNEEDESDFIEVEEERLDLRLYVEEALLLFMPFAPICDDECKGLCQMCGQNLNEHECSCNTERIDPRFAALKDLFKE